MKWVLILWYASGYQGSVAVERFETEEVCEQVGSRATDLHDGILSMVEYECFEPLRNLSKSQLELLK